MKATDLLVTAECVETGKRLIGYICSCKSCRTPFPDEEYDHSRPIGLLTHPDEIYGNVRVYTDTIEFVKQNKIFNGYLENSRASYMNNIHDKVFTCPKCMNKTLYPVDENTDIIGIGYHDLCICDECGAELWSEPKYNNTVKFVDIPEEKW